LQHILSISGTAGDALGGAKHADVVVAEEGFEFSQRFGYFSH
jgi:hypothetical protein